MSSVIVGDAGQSADLVYYDQDAYFENYIAEDAAINRGRYPIRCPYGATRDVSGGAHKRTPEEGY